eukprot:806990-Rhodomonas_salina.3
MVKGPSVVLTRCRDKAAQLAKTIKKENRLADMAARSNERKQERAKASLDANGFYYTVNSDFKVEVAATVTDEKRPEGLFLKKGDIVFFASNLKNN